MDGGGAVEKRGRKERGIDNKKKCKAKKKKKIMENTSLGINVSVYRVNDISDPAVKFKLEATYYK